MRQTIKTITNRLYEGLKRILSITIKSLKKPVITEPVQDTEELIHDLNAVPVPTKVSEQIAPKAITVEIITQDEERFRREYEEKTGKHAIWRGKLTRGYLKWRKKYIAL